jgi:hypothetical protein
MGIVQACVLADLFNSHAEVHTVAIDVSFLRQRRNVDEDVVEFGLHGSGRKHVKREKRERRGWLGGGSRRDRMGSAGSTL